MAKFEFDPEQSQSGAFEFIPEQAQAGMPGDALPPLAKAGMGIFEAAGNVASGGLGAAVGGLVGGSHAIMYGADRGAQISQDIQQGMTYQPQTRAGQQIQGAISAIPKWYSENISQPVADFAYEHSGAAVGAATKAGMESLPSLIAKGAKGPIERGISSEASRLAAAKSKNALRDETLKKAQDEGYVTPSPTVAGRALSSIGGKAQLRQDMTWHNQEVTNKIARREAGLQEDVPITDANLEAARGVMAAPYREVAKVSPRAKKAFDDMQQARADAKAQWRFYNAFPDPKVMKKAQAADKKADMLEGIIDSEAVRVSQGAPAGLAKTLVKDIRAARVAMAKNYDVERAVNKGTGDVDARYLGRMYDNGSPFTGGLETIARFSQGRGWEVTRDVSGVGIPGGQHGTAVEMAAGGAIGFHHGGVKGALLGAGLPFIRGPARMAAMSRSMQYQPSYTQPFSLSDLATRYPEGYMLAPPQADQPQPNPWERYSR